MNNAEAAKNYKALANRRRLDILALLLKNEELNVSAIAKGINLSYRSTSRHLQILKNANLVQSIQENLEQVYSIPDKTNIFIKPFISIR